MRKLSKIVDNKAVFSILDLSERMLAIVGVPAVVEGEYVAMGVVPKDTRLRRKRRPTTLRISNM